MRQRPLQPPAHVPGPSCVKHCPSCGTCFTRSDLIGSRALVPIGMQHIGGCAIFSFTHVRSSCQTTFALAVEAFRAHGVDVEWNGTDLQCVIVHTPFFDQATDQF